MPRCYIGLGANLGAAQTVLLQAASQLAASEGIGAFRLSALYRSAPVGACGPDYVNAVAQLDTALEPHALLTLLQALEQCHGRERPYPNAPRTLDLDLLLYGDIRIHDTTLTVPHPRMHERAFVLRPLQDLAPDLLLAQGSLATLLQACADQPLSPLG